MEETASEIGSESPPPRGVTWREVFARKHLPQLLVLCLAIWLHAANAMLAATTLPAAVGDIGGLRLISWAFALYLMGSILAATVISVSVARYGLRRSMLASTLVYTLGCAICATAPVMPVLLAGRAVQGLGGGALVALVYIAQDRFFPSRLWPRIMALLSVVWTVSALCGPLIGGTFATAGLWRFAFWSFALQSLLLAAAVNPLLARTRPETALQARTIPVVRLALVAGAILVISYAGTVNSAAYAGVLLLSGCVCVALFVVRDSSAKEPTRLLPGHATDLSHPVGCGFALTFLLCLCLMSFLVYGPILLIRLYNLTPLEAGLVVLTESLGWTSAAFFLSGLGPAQEGRLLRLGSATLLVGVGAQAWFLANGPLWLIVVSAFLGHAGFGMMWGYIIKLVIGNADHEDRNRAGSLLPSVQQTGFALGAALSGIIANGLGFEKITESEDYRNAAFWLFAWFIPPALIANLIAWRLSNQIGGSPSSTRTKSSGAS